MAYNSLLISSFAFLSLSLLLRSSSSEPLRVAFSASSEYIF
jgi:hypothetical protein